MLVLSTLTTNASAKLSEFDFSKWEAVQESINDVEDKEKDANYSGPPTGWKFDQVANGPSKVAEAEGNKFIQLEGYNQLYIPNAIADKYYVYSVDMKIEGKPNVGMFARVGEERFKYDANTSDFFEFDRSGNHDGIVALGGSGMYIRPEGKKLTLYIKLYDDEQPCDINNKIYTFETDVDFATDFRTVTLVDDGSTVFIYVEDNLIAKVTFSTPKTYPIGEEEYYSKVVVYGADGTELGSHDNALFAINSVVAFGDRNASAQIDNIILKTYKDAEATNPETSDSSIAFVTIVFAFSTVLVVLKKRVMV